VLIEINAVEVNAPQTHHDGDQEPAAPRGMKDAAMAYKIIASLCTSCGACELECPNTAISMGSFVYAIDPKKCTECKGFYDQPQCASVCPVPETCVPAGV
jgi:ferredoxin